MREKRKHRQTTKKEKKEKKINLHGKLKTAVRLRVVNVVTRKTFQS